MLDELISKINISSRLKIIIIVSLMLVLGHSLWFFAFITVLTLIILLIYNIHINIYINSLKSIIMILVIVILISFAITKDWIETLILIYKVLIIILLNINFTNTVTFDELNSGLNKVLKNLKKFSFDVQKISFELSIIIFYTKYLLESKKEVLNIQTLHGKRKYLIKSNLIPRLIFAINKTENLKIFLKEENYKQKVEKVNSKSKMLELSFIVLLIIVLIKEVII